MSSLYFHFLTACLRFQRDRARKLLHDPLWSWEDLFQVANDEAILATLASLVQELGMDASIPPDVLDFLSAVKSLNLEHNELILKEVRTVARLLNREGIEPVLLKGTAYLAASVYTNPGARYLLDVDLLIPEAQLRVAVGVLSQNGFERDDEDRFGYFRHHHPPLRRPGSISFELHHRLGMGPCDAMLPAREVIEHSIVHELDDAIVRLPSPEHLMTHLIMHSQIQHPYNERIWPPLRAMYDLVLLQRRFGAALNWFGIEQRFRNAGKYGLLAMHLLRVHDSLDLELPFVPRLTPFMRLRWCRRTFLRRMPALRYLDPIYMFATVCQRRLRVFRKAVRTPGGLAHLAAQFLEPNNYCRLLTDVLEGRGR
jgi:hypothetical protein